MTIWQSIKNALGIDAQGVPAPKQDNDITEKEVTTGGSTVYRYDDVETNDGIQTPSDSCVYLQEIEQHVESYIGEIHMVFHEIISDVIHIDVHWLKPSARYPYHIFVTSGMSDLSMSVVDEVEDKENYKRAELMIVLPADWKVSEEDFKDNNNYWPIYFLKMLARFPHQYNTWLGYGHTIPNGMDAEPIADTGFGCMLLLPPMLSFDEDFWVLNTKDGEKINFYTLIPLYKEEMDFKLEHGTEALMDKFDQAGISELVDIHRPNVCR